MSKTLLELKEVTVRRGDREALKSISFRIKAGENVAIFGPNGSGKSTLIKTITRECYPSHGSVKILNREMWDVFELRSRLGIVTPDQSGMFHDEITGREAVLSGFFSSVGIWTNNQVTREMGQKTRRILKFLDVSHLSDRLMTEMSSGEAQRILIARSLVHNPSALVLDEPTTSLDFTAVAEVQRVIRKLSRSGKNMIVVSHNLHDIIPEISRVILLRAGEIVMDGPKQEILTSQNLSRLFAMPIKIAQEKGYYHLT